MNHKENSFTATQWLNIAGPNIFPHWIHHALSARTVFEQMIQSYLVPPITQDMLHITCNTSWYGVKRSVLRWIQHPYVFSYVKLGVICAFCWGKSDHVWSTFIQQILWNPVMSDLTVFRFANPLSDYNNHLKANMPTISVKVGFK